MLPPKITKLKTHCQFLYNQTYKQIIKTEKGKKKKNRNTNKTEEVLWSFDLSTNPATVVPATHHSLPTWPFCLTRSYSAPPASLPVMTTPPPCMTHNTSPLPHFALTAPLLQHTSKISSALLYLQCHFSVHHCCHMSILPLSFAIIAAINPLIFRSHPYSVWSLNLFPFHACYLFWGFKGLVIIGSNWERKKRVWELKGVCVWTVKNGDLRLI